MISLFCAVFISLLGFGWLIDYFYGSVTEQEQQDVYSGYEQVLELAAKQVGYYGNNSELINEYLKDITVPVYLESLANYPLPKELLEQRDKGEIIKLESESGVTFHKRIGSTNQLISLGPVLISQDQDYQTKYVLTLLFYLSIAGILFVWLLPLLKGVYQLTSAAKSIGQGQLATRVPKEDSYYLKPLKQEFNAMAEKLQRLNDNNQLLSQAVSHELRTPLSRLRFAVDLIETRKTDEQRHEDIKRMGEDLDQMESLINELLLYARLDKEPKLNKEKVYFENYIQHLLEPWMYGGCNIAFPQNKNDKAVAIDARYFNKVIDNLVQNACKYGNEKILITCHWHADYVELNVEDDGEGIPLDEWQNIFKPFIRVDDQKTRKRQGFGLGLAICKRILHWHGGDITLAKSDELGGARFSVLLPLDDH